MIKLSADVKAILRTHIKTELEMIKKLLIDQAKTDQQKTKEIDQVIYRLQSLVDANVPAQQPAAQTADDKKTKPLFFRRNLDYGERNGR